MNGISERLSLTINVRSTADAVYRRPQPTLRAFGLKDIITVRSDLASRSELINNRAKLYELAKTLRRSKLAAARNFYIAACVDPRFLNIMIFIG